MTMHPFNMKPIDASWQECLQRGLSQLDPQYVKTLTQTNDWLPGPDKIFNAFSLPLNKVNYVLFGESPYPRKESANGYAFWDNAVKDLWSAKGMSKPVNRATSMRNILKMLLIAEEMIDPNLIGQAEIAQIDKSSLLQTNDALFNRLLQRGFLLLNATPILQSGPPQKDARAWQPFTRELLTCLLHYRPEVTLILFGNIAKTIDSLLPGQTVKKLYAEHPYNLSFISNPQVLDFFRPLHLLRA